MPSAKVVCCIYPEHIYILLVGADLVMELGSASSYMKCMMELILFEIIKNSNAY